jgi:hypothetical protein
VLGEDAIELGRVDPVGDLPTIVVDRVDVDGIHPASTRAENADLWPLRAITTVSPGRATVRKATLTFRVEPLVENRVWSAPTAAGRNAFGALA